MKLSALFAVLCLSLSAIAQQGQTSDVSHTEHLVHQNAYWVQGIAPGYWPTCTNGGAVSTCSSLTLYLSNGTVWCQGTIRTYIGGTLSLANNATNYVYLDPTSNCAPASSTSVFTSSQVPIAVVVTSGGVITTITDDRSYLAAYSSAGGGVSSITGDGTLITNSASTGAVTLTLGNAGAHKWWGNNTGSSAAPGYQTIGNSDLPGTGAITINGTSCTLGSSCSFSGGGGGGGAATTLCKSTGLTDTLTAAGTFATTCAISASTTVFGTQIDVYAVGTEHIVSGDNHQYGLASGESGGQISQIGHSALTGDYVWSAHWGFTILYDASHSSLQSTGFAMTTGQCFVYEQNGGGSKFFSCVSVGIPFTPSSSHTMSISVGNFAAGSNSVLTSFWVTQTDP